MEIDIYWVELNSLDVSACRELTELWCSGLKLTSLNVSKNTKLINLYCANNNISALDLSKNTELEYLNCTSNVLSYLDVSANSNLYALYCANNKLTTLDLSSHSSISWINCSYNSITDLYLSSYVYYLDCSYNKLKTFTIAQGVGISELNCANNELTSLDIKNAQNLYGLDCSNNNLTRLDVYKNTSLSELNCDGNQLSELNVRANTELMVLNCSNNRLTELDVSKNTELHGLFCAWNYLTALDLSSNADIFQLDCSNNYIEKSKLTGIDADKLDTEGYDDNSYYGYYVYTFSPQAAGMPWVPPFLDVPRQAWYLADVRYALENSLFAGTSDTTFSPNDTMTRGMLATVLWRFAGKPASSGTAKFTDVPADAYYSAPVAWAQENGIVRGTSDTTFSPDDAITREQFTAILYKYAGKLGKASAAGLPGIDFFDRDDISGYAVDSVRWCVKAKIISGFPDGTFGPQENATRAQVAKMLHVFADTVK